MDFSEDDDEDFYDPRRPRRPHLAARDAENKFTKKLAASFKTYLHKMGKILWQVACVWLIRISSAVAGKSVTTARNLIGMLYILISEEKGFKIKNFPKVESLS